MADQIVFNAEQMKVVTAGERVSTIHWGVRSVEKKYASILESREGMISHVESALYSQKICGRSAEISTLKFFDKST